MMEPMTDDALQNDVQVLKEKVALLDGWRMGESERYDRLERDLTGIYKELRGFRADVDGRFATIDKRFAAIDNRLVQMDAKIDAQGQHLGARIDAQGQDLCARIDAQGQTLGARIDESNRRINQILWLMLITLTGVATNLVVLLLK